MQKNLKLPAILMDAGDIAELVVIRNHLKYFGILNELIKKQFECMASYLDWNMLFYKPFYANGKDEIRNNAELVKELKELGSNL